MTNHKYINIVTFIDKWHSYAKSTTYAINFYKNDNFMLIMCGVLCEEFVLLDFGSIRSRKDRNYNTIYEPMDNSLMKPMILMEVGKLMLHVLHTHSSHTIGARMHTWLMYDVKHSTFAHVAHPLSSKNRPLQALVAQNTIVTNLMLFCYHFLLYN